MNRSSPSISDGDCVEESPKQQSIPSFDTVRLLPKVELHAHLNGCIREATLLALASERGVTLSTHHFFGDNGGGGGGGGGGGCGATVSGYVRSVNHPRRSLSDCFEIFLEIAKCVTDLVALRRIAFEALQDFSDHHVIYLELRSTPKRLLRNDGHTTTQGQQQPVVATKREYVETILSVMKEFNEEEQRRYRKDEVVWRQQSEADRGSSHLQPPRLPMVCRYLVSLDRSQTVEEAWENTRLAVDLVKGGTAYSSLVVGVDVGGNPCKGHFTDLLPVLAVAREAGLKITLHCAEVADANEEIAVMLDFGPDRLGHALLLPPKLQSRLVSQRIPVEVCPTSNVMTLELAKVCNEAEDNDNDTDVYNNGRCHSLVAGLQQHGALRDWLLGNHPVAICTDDPGVFDTTPTQELLLLSKTFGLNLRRLTDLVDMSLEHSFCDANTLTGIKERFQNHWGQQPETVKMPLKHNSF